MPNSAIPHRLTLPVTSHKAFSDFITFEVKGKGRKLSQILITFKLKPDSNSTGISYSVINPETVKDATGSFNGFSSKDDAIQAAFISQFLNGGTPAAVFLYLYVSGSTGYYGNALLDATVDVDTNSLQKFSANWESSDEWYQNVG